MRTINVDLRREPRSYDIKIERGLATDKALPGGFVITDSNIVSIQRYADLIKIDDAFVVDAGEKSKSPNTYIEIARHIPEGAKRIIAFGGGVVGDLAGFVASTYRRGIPLVNIPTTLLAMVDSSIGGKNGINLRRRKNYLGTIYQPEEVLIDPLFLDTLPEMEFRNGVAEIIKYAAIFGTPDLERLARGVRKSDKDLERIIAQCCKLKAEVVQRDERDSGYRHTLNSGHTIGHAIELLLGRSHGETVSTGIAYELRLGKEYGIIDDGKLRAVIGALKANGLPTELPFGINTLQIIELMKADKKGPFIFAFDEKHYAVQAKEKDVRRILNQ